MTGSEQNEGFVEKLSRQGEEALGKIAEELIANPVVNGAVARAFEARERAVQAQEAALGLEERLAGVAAKAMPDERLGRIDGRLEEISRDLSRLREAVAPSEDPIPRAQERLTVTES